MGNLFQVLETGELFLHFYDVVEEVINDNIQLYRINDGEHFIEPVIPQDTWTPTEALQKSIFSFEGLISIYDLRILPNIRI